MLRVVGVFAMLLNLGRGAAPSPRRIVVVLTFALVLLTCSALPQNLPSQPAPDFNKLVHQFDYDPKAPLDVRETIIDRKDGVTIRDVSYASPRGGRVTAYMVVPDAPGPHPAILFGHWGPGNRTEFLSEAILYGKDGAVSLLIDYPWMRPAPWRVPLSNGVDEPEHDRDVQIQALIDLRRGLDLLASRTDVDAKRIAYIGHSYGAQWGAILSAIDKRLKTAILMGGVREAADIYLRNPDPDLAAMRQKTPMPKLENYLAIVGTLDAVRYVPHSRVPLLFQFARYERYFDKQSMDAYFDTARQPKQQIWYDTGHELNAPQALQDRRDWLRKYIGLR
jgi:cephalosporin-C deacetylase-like acetyl esterase